VRRAEAGRVAAHEVPLELVARLGRHGALAERTAARVEAVDDAARAREREELAVARLEPLAHAVAERDARAVGDAAERFEAERRGWREQHAAASAAADGAYTTRRLPERYGRCNR
jgi:hypothetical protein